MIGTTKKTLNTKKREMPEDCDDGQGRNDKDDKEGRKERVTDKIERIKIRAQIVKANRT